MADELRRKFKIVECSELYGGRSAGAILIVCGPLQNVYVSLQNRQKMTCLEADVHVWIGVRAATEESHACATSDVLAFG